MDVLRRGVEMLGLKEPLMLAQFKPALAINPAIQANYAANRHRHLRAFVGVRLSMAFSRATAAVAEEGPQRRVVPVW